MLGRGEGEMARAVSVERQTERGGRWSKEAEVPKEREEIDSSQMEL
jgi:hypothetical protein